MDIKQILWSYDIDTYERSRKMVQKMNSISLHNLNRKFWVDRANEVAARYPSAKLESIE